MFRRDADLVRLEVDAHTAARKATSVGAVHDDSPDPGVSRLAQLTGSCDHAMHDEVGSGPLPRRSAVASSPPELTPRPAPSSATHRAMAVGQERLACINQASLRERRAVAPNPMTKVGLVDDVGRGAEFIGDFGQRYLTDTKATQLIDVSGQWPYRPVYSGRGWRSAATAGSHRGSQLLSTNGIHNAPRAFLGRPAFDRYDAERGCRCRHGQHSATIDVSHDIDGRHDPSDDRVIQSIECRSRTR